MKPKVKGNSYKATVVGTSNVGKTSLLTRILSGSFSGNTETTTSVHIHSITLTSSSEQQVNVNFWDTAGQERFRGLGSLYYQSAVFCVAVFDASQLDTFTTMKEYISMYEEHCHVDPRVVIAGNKLDLVQDKEKLGSFFEWAEEHGYAMFLTSALTGDGIEDLKAHIADALVQKMETVVSEPDNAKMSITISDEPIKGSSCC